MSRIDYLNDSTAPKANTIIPAASAVIADEQGRILLQRRSDNDLWALPGGTMEIGETIKQTIIREVKEETGLDIQPIYIVGIYSDPQHVIAFNDGEVRQEFSICFYCISRGGSLKISEESSRIGFHTPKEIESLPMHPSNKQRVDDFLNGKRETLA